jgi:hypothetical protein
MNPLIIGIIGSVPFFCMLAWACCIVSGRADDLTEAHERERQGAAEWLSGAGGGEIFNHMGADR